MLNKIYILFYLCLISLDISSEYAPNQIFQLHI